MHRSFSHSARLVRSLAFLVAICLSWGDVIAGNQLKPAFDARQTSEANIEALIRFLDGELAQPYELSTRSLQDKQPIGKQREFAFATDQGYTLVEPAFFQPQPALMPAPSAPMAPSLPSQARSISASLFGTFGVPRSMLVSSSRVVPASATIVSGLESQIRLTTDAGNLLDKSPAVLQIGVQRRNPVIADPRLRGSRVGSLAASGSYWVPARIDLDTMLSKIDSRNIDQIAVIPGPYTALLGPGVQFIDTDLKQSPRYGANFETHGSSIAEFKSNGDQWHGRQNIRGGNHQWGFRGGYGHRTGNDYTTGTGSRVPSSYKSRDAYVSVGTQLSKSSRIEFQYLRLDQTDVELPGQAFDIDFLVTDGYEIILTLDDRDWCDQFEVTSWYNNTRLEGSAQRSGKRATFPVYDSIMFEGFTNVNSSSAGYRAAATWGGECNCEPTLTAGADLRYVKQELNEFTSSILSGGDVVNSPIPNSHQATPGFFFEIQNAKDSQTQIRAGGRVDWDSSNIDIDPADLQPLPVGTFSAAELLGSGVFDQHELLGLGFVALDRSLSGIWDTGVSVGYAERAPNLTERYAIFPFMFLLQNGLNTVTGDPELKKERRIQFDWRISFKKEHVRSQLTLFHAWSLDHITFENFNNPPLGGGDSQVQLKYVNTELAVFRGIESRSEIDVTKGVIAFANLKYVEGEDRTRNGDFATAPASFGTPSFQDPAFPRGAFGGIAGNAIEPLPGILPLEARLGLRFEEPVESPAWGIEVSARLVDRQDRVAVSLLESPTTGFATGDLRGYWRPREGLYLAAGLENFTNTRYREHLDFRSLNQAIQILQPGANFYTSAEINY